MAGLSLILFAYMAQAVTPDAVRVGPGDLLTIRALHVPEMPERPVRVDDAGFVQLAMIGRVEAAGRTTQELSKDIERRLVDLVREPQVTVEVMETRSRPVSVFGSVRKPGVYQMDRPKLRLVELLPIAGGLEPDAGSRVIVARANGGAVETIPMSKLMNGQNTDQYWVFPNDSVTVPRAKLIYVLGDVRRPGGFPLKDDETITALQALALAEGAQITAATKNSRIIRKGDEPSEQTVNLRSVLEGKAQDFALEPNDILFVPSSASKRTSIKIAEAAMQMAVGAVIWRR
ncbi:polysaccharide export protein Wza [Bryobacterales bacterium F-183]|nr:polysaccharide export protein Wza [Bryobacterales bacterium F-183]